MIPAPEPAPPHPGDSPRAHSRLPHRPPLPRLPRQRRGDAGAGGRSAPPRRHHPPGRRRARPRAPPLPRQAAAARPRPRAGRSAVAVPGNRPARRARHVRRGHSRRRHHHRHRPRLRPRVHDRRQRRHGEGRHLLPDDGEEAPARAGDRARRTGCPASTWWIPAAPTCRSRTRCSPTASISAASSSTRPTCRRRASRRSRW